MPYTANSPFIDANETFNYERQVLNKGKTIVDLKGSRLEQKILTAAVNQSKLITHIRALEGMSACAGIRGNERAAYKARVNHYGGISSWGFTLPIRRWVDAAYSDIKVGLGGYGVVYKNYQGKNSKAIADYIKGRLVATPKSIPGTTKIVTYDEWVDTKEGKAFAKDFNKRYPMYLSPQSNVLRRTDVKSLYDLGGEDLSTRLRRIRKNRERDIAWKKEISAISVDGSGMIFEVVDQPEIQAGLFGARTSGSGTMYPDNPSSFMKGLANKMKVNQVRAIRNMWPPNAESTERIKGFNKPLIWTGEMLNSIEGWVDKS